MLLNKNERQTKEMRILIFQYTFFMCLYGFFFQVRYLIIGIIWYKVLNNSPMARTVAYFIKRQVPKLQSFAYDICIYSLDSSFMMIFSRQRKRIIIKHLLLSPWKNFWIVNKLDQWRIISIPPDTMVNDYSTDDNESIVSNENECNIDNSE